MKYRLWMEFTRRVIYRIYSCQTNFTLKPSFQKLQLDTIHAFRSVLAHILALTGSLDSYFQGVCGIF